MSDGNYVPTSFPVPLLKIGEKTELVLRHVHVTPPGNTVIRVPAGLTERGQPFWITLYAYTVREEGAYWASAIGVLLVMAGIGIGVLLR